MKKAEYLLVEGEAPHKRDFILCEADDGSDPTDRDYFIADMMEGFGLDFEEFMVCERYIDGRNICRKFKGYVLEFSVDEPEIGYEPRYKLRRDA